MTARSRLPGAFAEDTINHRLSGKGEFDTPGFLSCVQKAGYTGPYRIEVLSQELRQKAD